MNSLSKIIFNILPIIVGIFLLFYGLWGIPSSPLSFALGLSIIIIVIIKNTYFYIRDRNFYISNILVISSIFAMILVFLWALTLPPLHVQLNNNESIYLSHNQISQLEENVSRLLDMPIDSRLEFEFNMPKDIKKICFVGNNNPESNYTGNWESNKILQKMITENDFNLFFYEDDKIPEGRKIKYLIPIENFCISESKRMCLENKGRYVTIKIEE